MVINPTPAPRRWTIKVRVTEAPQNLRGFGAHQWSLWCGMDPQMIRIMKATHACHFDQASKRWYFVKPAAEYGKTLQRLLDLGYRIDLEDPRRASKKLPNVRA